MREMSEFNGFNQGWAIGFKGVCGTLNQDFFLVGERPLWVEFSRFNSQLRYYLQIG